MSREELQRASRLRIELSEIPVRGYYRDGKWVRSYRRHGELAPSGWGDSLVNALHSQGGFTFHPAKGTPTKGVSVSVYPDREKTMPIEEVTPESLNAYYQQNRDILDDPESNRYFGGWVEDGKVYLDISVVAADTETAMTLARENQQKSVYDLGTKKTTYVDPVGWNMEFTRNNIEWVAAGYEALPEHQDGADSAWEELAVETSGHADYIRKHINVSVTDDPEPYANSEEMIRDIRENRNFIVSRANSEHPVWSVEQNIDFRIVHDVFGHAATDGDFGWSGENSACSTHFAISSPNAAKALTTECLGQTGYAIDRGGFTVQKIGFIPGLYEQLAKANKHTPVPTRDQLMHRILHGDESGMDNPQKKAKESHHLSERELHFGVGGLDKLGRKKGKFTEALHPRGFGGKFGSKTGPAPSANTGTTSSSTSKVKGTGPDPAAAAKQATYKKKAWGLRRAGTEARVNESVAKGTAQRAKGDATTTAPVGYIGEHHGEGLNSGGHLSQKALLQYVNEAKTKPSTVETYAEPGPDGQWVFQESRREVHRKIIEAMLLDKDGKPLPSQEKPRVFFTGGGYSAGKGGVLKRMKDELPKDAVVLDPDRIKAMLPEYEQLVETDPEANLVTYEEAWAIAQEVQAVAQERKINMIVDGISNTSADEFLARVRSYTDAGYVDPRVVYVDVPTEEAMSRAANRAKNAEDVADRRHIPDVILRSVHRDVAGTIFDVAERAGEVGLRMEVWDNHQGKAEDGSFNPPKKFMEVNGKEPHFIDQPLVDALRAKSQETIQGVTDLGTAPSPVPVPKREEVKMSDDQTTEMAEESVSMFGLSEDEIAARLERLDELESKARERSVDDKVAQFSEKFGDSPALLTAVRDILLSDDGEIAILLSEDGADVPVKMTATEIVEKVLDLVPTRDVTLSEQVSRIPGDESHPSDRTDEFSHEDKLAAAAEFLRVPAPKRA